MTDEDLKRFGWAPGHYTFRCNRCNCIGDGDKRCTSCRRCAEELHRGAAEMVAKLDAVADAPTKPMSRVSLRRENIGDYAVITVTLMLSKADAQDRPDFVKGIDEIVTKALLL